VLINGLLLYEQNITENLVGLQLEYFQHGLLLYQQNNTENLGSLYS
jgi:hypothetical protein